MMILLILFSFVLIECSVGAPVLGCSSELEGFKEMVKAKADIKASLVAALLEQVNAIDIQTKDGDTLLMLAARNGLTDVVDELLNLKAIVTVSKDTIAAASKLANEAGFQEVVEILRSASVEVNEKDEDVNTALHRASEAGDQDTWSWPILSADAYFEHTEMLELYLNTTGVEVSAGSNGGLMVDPLYIAAVQGRIEFVKMYLRLPGVDVNVKNSEGETPLNGAAYEGQTEVVEILLKTPGVDVNIKNSNGDTPIYRAARRGHDEIVKMLKAAGAVMD